MTVAAAGSPRRSRFHGSLVPVLLFAPCALIYAVFFIWPQAALLAISTSDKSGFTLQHYGRFFGDLYYWEMLGRTLGMGVAVTAITLILGVPTAYVLARLQSRWAGFLLLLTTFPLLVSAVVRSFGWMVLFFKDGLVSRTLVLLGVFGPAGAAHVHDERGDHRTGAGTAANDGPDALWGLQIDRPRP